jgi:hypothetical protein
MSLLSVRVRLSLTDSLRVIDRPGGVRGPAGILVRAAEADPGDQPGAGAHGLGPGGADGWDMTFAYRDQADPGGSVRWSRLICVTPNETARSTTPHGPATQSGHG